MALFEVEGLPSRWLNGHKQVKDEIFSKISWAF